MTDTEQTERDIVERLSYLIDHIDQHLIQDLADALADAFDEITRLRAQPSPREATLRDDIEEHLWFLRKAIEVDDPKQTLLFRLDEMKRALSQASEDQTARTQERRAA